jgi:hypothetical protein
LLDHTVSADVDARVGAGIVSGGLNAGRQRTRAAGHHGD